MRAPHAGEVDLPVPPAKRRRLSPTFTKAKIRVRHGAVVVEHMTDGTCVALAISELAAIFLGHGTSISDDALDLLSQYGVGVIFVSGERTRVFSSSQPLARSAGMAERQALRWANKIEHLMVVHDMYERRFGADYIPKNLAEAGDAREQINCLRGMEGDRVKLVYRRLAHEYGVTWKGRTSKLDYNDCDIPNKCLHTAHSLLRGYAHSVVTMMGLAPQIGFIHVNSQLAMSMDLADLFQTEIADRIAFSVASINGIFDDEVSQLVRDAFSEETSDGKLSYRMVDVLVSYFGVNEENKGTGWWDSSYFDDLM